MKLKDLLGPLFGFAEVADAALDIGTVAAHLKGAPDNKSDLDKNRRIGAAIVQIAGPFWALDEPGRKAYIADSVAIRRLTQDYYDRLDEDAQDQFERLWGEVWASILEGLGVRQQQPQPQNQPKKGQHQPRPQGQNPLGDIPAMSVLLAVQASIGKAAIVADGSGRRGKPNSTKGDAVITDELERLSQATLSERVAKKTAKGLDLITGALKQYNDRHGF